MNTSTMIRIPALTIAAVMLLAACGGSAGDEGILGGSISLRAEAISPTRIRLTWSRPSGGVTTTSYIVRRDDAGSTASVGSTSERTYEVAGLNPSTRYCFKITNPLLGMIRSNTACATTHADSTAPSTPGGLTVNALSPGEVDMSWDFASDDHRVQGYNVIRDGSPLLSTSAIAAIDAGATPGATHCYRVTAVDASGNESSPTAESCVTMPEDLEDPSIPTNLRASYSDSGDQPGNRLTWTASTDDGVVRYYRVHRDDGSVADAADTVHNDHDLQPDTSYCYTVTAVDAAGKESGHSNVACARASWSKTGLSTLNVFQSAISTDSADNPHIAYKMREYDSATREFRIELRYINLQPGKTPSFEILEEDLETYFPGDDYEVDILVDNSDLVHIAHKLNKPPLPEQVQYLQISSGLVRSSTIQESPNSTNSISLAVDSVGAVHACYDLGNTLLYAHNGTGSWTITDTDSLVPGTAGYNCAIAVDASDKVHISFTAESSKDLQYLSNHSGDWALATLDLHSGTPISTSHHTSIATDADGNAHIAYFHDFADQDLEYATNASGTWVTTKIDTEGNVGYDCEIAIDPNGFAHIVYRDLTSATLLKYANNLSDGWETAILSGAGIGNTSIAVDSIGKLHVTFTDANQELAYLTNRD